MFCGWGHKSGCECNVCVYVFVLTHSQQTRYNRKSRQAKQASEEDDMLKKPAPGQMYGTASTPFVDEEFINEYPTITEYLFTSKWTDGSVRATSTLSIFTDGDAMKVVLNDRDNNRSAFFCEATFSGAMHAMEKALREDKVDWKSRSSSGQAAKQIPF